MKKLFLAMTVLFVMGAGCSSGTPTPSPSTPPVAPPAATPTPAPAATSPDKVTVKFSGAFTKEGTFDARCAPYFVAENKGVVFETHVDGWWLQVGDGEDRTAGVQTDNDIGILNGPTASYMLVREGAQITFGPNMKSAIVKARFKRIYQDEYVNVDATFTCGG